MFDFLGLEKAVKELGMDPDHEQGSFRVFTEKLTKQELDDQVEIVDDGIFYTDENGVRYKGFLYIEKGYDRQVAISKGWNSIVPKFHVLNCSTLDQMKDYNKFDQKYVFANESQEMEDLDGEIKEVELCKNCIRKHYQISSVIPSSVYVEKYIRPLDQPANFKPKDLPKRIDIRKLTYSPDWPEESKAYREKNDFICESCGIQLNENYYDGYYLETHHKNGLPGDNRESNLQCLCVLCHAHVNPQHEYNYRQGKNKRKLRDFIQQYEKKLKSVGNSHLAKHIHD